jgi:hypothetical protein
MDFFKKLRFWKRKRNEGVTTRDIATTMDILYSETGTQVDSILTCETSTQTSNVEERPRNRTDGGAAEKVKEEILSKVAAMEKLLEEQNATIQEMKERQKSHIQSPK